MKYDLNINSAIGKDDLAPGMYPVIIYQLIRQYSNENNPLTLDDIMDTLSEYWKGDSKKESAKTNLQKTLKRNLEPLLYFDTNIHAEYGDGRTFFIESGDSIGKIKKIWYEQELSQTDIQLLSDSVVYSKHMPKKRRLELLEKIMRAGGQSTISHSEWYHNIIKDAEDTSIRVSGDLYNKLDYVNDAIQNKKCLSFDYSFSGPKQAKYKVRSYTRVSPYRIILESGIYYLVASRNPDEKRDSLFSEYNHSTPLVFLEIHKMDSIRTDGNKQDYQNICKTVGDKKTLQEIISAGYHPLTHEIIPFKFKVTVISFV